jgi:hypothetical protein
MTKFDVNDLLFSFDSETDGRYQEVFDWLEENIGKKTEQNTLMSPVYARGQGWAITTHREVYDGMNVLSWSLEITEPAQALLFALKWGLNGQV